MPCLLRKQRHSNANNINQIQFETLQKACTALCEHLNATRIGVFFYCRVEGMHCAEMRNVTKEQHKRERTK